MKTKRKPKPLTFQEPVETFTVGEVENPVIPLDGKSTVKPKISIPINEDGSFDFSSMRDATKERLRVAIASSPSLFPSTVTEVAAFPPQVIWMMYGAIGSIESMLAQRMGKIPKSVADSVFTYTPQELELLTPPTSRILQKYASEWMIKYQDEIALATLITSMTISKVNAALMLSRQATVVEMPKKEDKPEVVQ